MALTSKQAIYALVEANDLVEALIEAKIYSRRNMDADRKAEADDDVARKFHSLAAELGYLVVNAVEAKGREADAAIAKVMA